MYYEINIITNSFSKSGDVLFYYASKMYDWSYLWCVLTAFNFIHQIYYNTTSTANEIFELLVVQQTII